MFLKFHFFDFFLNLAGSREARKTAGCQRGGERAGEGGGAGAGA